MKLLKISASILLIMGVIFTNSSISLAPAALAADPHGTIGNTVLTAGVCSAGSGWCITSTSPSGNKEILVSPSAFQCTTGMQTTLAGSNPEVIGNHSGTSTPEIATTYCLSGTSGMRAGISIVDIDAGSVIGSVVSPNKSGITASYIAFPKDSLGREYPTLAPGYGDSSDSASSSPLWGYICSYRVGTSNTGRCGQNFMEIPAAPAGSYLNPQAGYFREVGGYLEDLDNDGWEDVSLIYHSLIYTVSIRTGLPISTTVFNIASKDPYAATDPWFHSGRNYGTHTSVKGSDGQLRNVIIGGVPVGELTDAFCNVSRFVAVLKATPGNPGSRKLDWANSYGFADNIFLSTDPSLSNNPPVGRLGDFENGCIHRFSDGLSTIGTTPVVIFNYFKHDAVADQCLKEQYSYYQPGNDGSAWLACLNKNLKSRMEYASLTFVRWSSTHW
jgi:hypothetical protein